MTEIPEVFWSNIIEVAPYAAVYIVTIILLQWNHYRHNKQLERVHDKNINTIKENFETTYKHLIELYGIKENN